MPRERADILASLTGKGFRLEQKSRDHDFLFLEQAGLTQAVFTKVSRGSSYATLGDELLSRMSKQLRLTRKEFDELVDCPMDEATYLAKLRERGVLRGSRPR
jgi:hypothetical protein